MFIIFPQYDKQNIFILIGPLATHQFKLQHFLTFDTVTFLK